MLPGSHAEAVGGRCGLLVLGWFEGLPSRLAFECLAGCAVYVLAGAGGVVADLLSDELFAGDALSVAFVGVVVGVAFGDELVAFGEAFEGAFGGGAVEDEVAKGGFQFGEDAVFFAVEVLLAVEGVEAGIAAFGVGQLRVGCDEPGQGFLGTDGHDAVPLNSWTAARWWCGLLVPVRCTPRPRSCTGVLQELFEPGAISLEGLGVGTGGPGGQVGDDRRRGAEQGDAGAEAEGADAVGWQDRHPPYGALVRWAWVLWTWWGGWCGRPTARWWRSPADPTPPQRQQHRVLRLRWLV